MLFLRQPIVSELRDTNGKPSPVRQLAFVHVSPRGFANEFFNSVLLLDHPAHYGWLYHVVLRALDDPDFFVAVQAVPPFSAQVTEDLILRGRNNADAYHSLTPEDMMFRMSEAGKVWWHAYLEEWED